MKNFSSTLAVAVVSSFSALIAAGPIGLPRYASPNIAKRGGSEALYMVDCEDYFEDDRLSLMAYYTTGLWASQEGQTPDALAYAGSPDTGAHGVDESVNWAGSQFTATFGLEVGYAFGTPNGAASGATATSDLNPGADSLPVGAFAGTAQGSFGQSFLCYKDSGRELFREDPGSQAPHFVCASVYYCFDVNWGG